MYCFVISPIGSEGSEVRANADQVFDYIICPALEPLGYKVERADKISESGLITTQIVERIVSSDLVVADLTDLNANVFYELAIRHVTGKPFIHMIFDGQKIPFDVAASRTIPYSLDLAGANKGKLELERQAQAFLNNNCKVENPISVALDLNALSHSEDPVQTALGRIEAEITKVRGEVAAAMDVQKNLLGEAQSDTRYFLRNALSNEFFPIERGDDHSRPTYWDNERVEILKQMWGEGASASTIAQTLGGISRNAVIAKIHRLGLQRQKGPDNGTEG